jgi:hypothetical protein
MNVQQAAVAFMAAQQVYHETFREHFGNDVAELTVDRFWELAPVFTGCVYKYRFGYGRSNGAVDAADEFFRKARVSDFRCFAGQPVVRYSLEEAACFAKTWGAVKSKLYQPLFNVVAGHSDDAYSDLLDSLPLAGREVVDMAIGGRYTSDRHFTQSVRDACGKHEQDKLAGFILQGENYIAMHLYDAAQTALALEAAERARACCSA